MEIIYCAGGNRRFADIAIAAGFLYGSQLPETVYHPLHFADQNWKKPDRGRYMDALAQHKPHMATVLDLERHDQLDEVLSWAEEAAQYVQTVVIIPKAFEIIAELPRRIGGADVRLGYSVPTSYGGTSVPVWEFVGWPVHLLGGNPQKQMALTHYLNVHSVDGNAAQRAAVGWCMTWQGGVWIKEKFRGDDAMYVAFERSCRNIMAAWRQVTRIDCRTAAEVTPQTTRQRTVRSE